jgi:hypothetical protein
MSRSFENSLCSCVANKNMPTLHLQGFFRAVKWPQKLNLELSFETQSSHQKILCSKMKLFELRLNS